MRRIQVALLLLSLSPIYMPAAPGFFRPPAFIGGIPGRVQMQSIATQRHQARTLLYQQAIEELRRNPGVVDVPECVSARAVGVIPCLPKTTAMPKQIAGQPVMQHFALLIGNQRYLDPVPQLETPIYDAEAVADTLRQRFGFANVTVLRDATKANIITAVASLTKQVKPSDSVFIFYAGHGYLMDDTQMGYWIPTDGSTKTAAQWLSNKDISKLLRAIPARQIILVSDSCFSGSLTREKPISLGRRNPKEVLRKRSVLVLSSGGEEPVSDEGQEGHSIFAWHLLRSLSNVKNTTLGQNIYQIVRSGVTADYPQTPQYGAMLTAGHEEGGEYLFDPE